MTAMQVVILLIPSLVANLFLVKQIINKRTDARDKKIKAEQAQMEMTSQIASLQKINAELIEGAEQAQTELTCQIASLKKISAELKEEAEQAKASLQEVSRQLENLKNNIGHRIKKLEIGIYITDYYGTCHTVWKWNEIAKVRPGAVLTRIPGRLRFAAPSSISTYPTLSPKYSKKYNIKFDRKETSYCDFQIVLNEDSDNVSYEYTADINKAFYMTEEEVTEPHQSEWFEFNITAVIETLVILVSFPSRYYPEDIRPDAYEGFFPGNKSDESEIKRIFDNAGFESKKESCDVSLTVTNPTIGYGYCIRWKPLSKMFVEAMRQKENKMLPKI